MYGISCTHPPTHTHTEYLGREAKINIAMHDAAISSSRKYIDKEVGKGRAR